MLSLPVSVTVRRGFTLLETVIAIGVLAVLLSGFMVVFTPAAQGIKKSLDVQQSDRLTATLESELTILRSDQRTSIINGNFEKAFEWIKGSNALSPTSATATTALLLYQYRGNRGILRADGTPTPVPTLAGMLPGTDYQVTPILRRRNEANLASDLAAVEGSVYLVKCTQLIHSAGNLILGTPGVIVNPTSGVPSAAAAAYNEAVIVFSAEFYALPTKSATYVTGSGLGDKYPNLRNPIFVRNLAVRR